MEATQTLKGLFLSQRKYILDLLHNTKVHDAKAVNTPMLSSECLKLHDGAPPHDATEYRQVLGSLQYLSLTRPDINFAVNKLAQFMHRPSTFHWIAVKRLLHYLKGISHYGLFLSSSSPFSLHAFADADWASDVDTHHSTSTYIVFLGANPIN